jgi:hypothetical protein
VVEWHHNPKNRFAPETEDDVWLSIVGQKDWIVFSHDQKWHDELVNREAIKQHKIGCFYLWGGSSTTWEKLRCFVRACQNIQRLAESTEKPFIYKVDYYARVKRIPIP